MPDKCPCMKSEEWSLHIGAMVSGIGRDLQDQVDRSGLCPTGVRELLVSVVVAAIMAAEGTHGLRNSSEILEEVKRRIELNAHH